MEIFLSAQPGEIRAAAAAGIPLAHAAYRIGEDSSLLSQNLLVQTRGGVMVVTDAMAPQVRSPRDLAGAIARQCGRRDYGGVVLDFERPFREDLGDLAAALGRQCGQMRRRLYLPRAYAHAAPEAAVIVNSAVSGGRFEDYLQETAQQLEGRCLALDVQRLGRRFALPDGSGEGQDLSVRELGELMVSLQPTVFFSRDLCAKYFTYTREGVTSFVLFDDAATLRQKLHIGEQMGLSAAFFQWPEIQDLWEDLFAKS